MARPVKAITASKQVRAELERRAKASASAHRDRFRAQIILLPDRRFADRGRGQANGRVDASGVEMVEPLRAVWARRPQGQNRPRLQTIDPSGEDRAHHPSAGWKRWSVRSMGGYAWLPLAPGRPRTMTHDYTRHGTVTLFAALNALEGKLIARTEERHSHVEWLRFLNQIDRETPKDLDIHLIQDNYATHKHPKVKAWLDRHSRFKCHFTPASSSWLNLVERFFADLTEDVIRTGSFGSVSKLARDIKTYLDRRNANPKPYKWKAKGEVILEKSAGHAPPSIRWRPREIFKCNRESGH
jgi:transposase